MKHWVRLAVAGLLSLAAGCASTPTPEIEPAELKPFTVEVELQRRWSARVGSGLGEAGGVLQPWVADDRIVAADIEGRVMAFDRQQGELLWQVTVDAPLSGGLGGDAELLYLGTLEGEVRALSLTDGSERWRAQLSSEILAPPQANRRLVIAQTSDGKVFALERESGERRWAYSSVTPSLSLRGTATPLVTEAVSFIGFANGKLVALDNASGRVVWEQRIALPQGRTDIERLVDIDGQPQLEQGLVYVTSYQGRAAALDARSGGRRWDKEVSSYRAPALDFGNLYVVSDASHVLALDARSGASVWVQDQLEGRRLTAPVTLGSYLAVADFEGYVHVLAQLDGRLVGRRQLDNDGIRAPLVAADETLYVLTNSGRLLALTLEPVSAKP